MLKILAIESSCDETCASVVNAQKGGINPLSSIVSSQIKIHRATHGVVPEVAARAHIQRIGGVVSRALRQSGSKLSDIDHIAVTVGPGLISSLLVGAEYARALSLALGKKIIPVNHMLGHLYSAFVSSPDLKLPSINLIVSGGHTYLVLMKTKKSYKVLGQTVDDAAGEAFDKIAKMLDLPYPGGPEVSKLALLGKHDFNFPRPMIHEKNYNFSFSGLKTAVLYKIRDEKLDLSKKQVKADICMSFQNAVIDVLVSKTMRAAAEFGAKSITLSGGVAANKLLRAKLSEAAKNFGAKFYVPDFSLCTDNALMIANAAAIQLANGFKPVSPLRVKVNPNMQM